MSAQKQSRAHRAIAEVTGDFERFHFNRAVANMRELSNAIEDLAENEPGSALRSCAKGLKLAKLVGAYAAAYRRGNVGKARSQNHAVRNAVAESRSFAFDRGPGYHRRASERQAARNHRPAARRGGKDAEAAALADANVQRAMDGKNARKIIVVPNKIINVVA